MAHILLTNDDGIEAAGLRALLEALRPLARVSVLAPDHNWSAAGHTKTMHKPLRVDHYPLPSPCEGEVPVDGDEVVAYTTTGAPSDCVALALLGVLPEQPDLVVSGINQGANLGHDVTYSGTVAAAMEAVISGLPAVAISLDSQQSQSFDYAARVGASVVARVLERGLPAGTFLNVNVPNCHEDKIAGLRVTRLGRRVYRDLLVRREDPRGRPYYWIGGEPPTGHRDEGTDIWAVANRYVSVTPIHLDMTAHELIPQLGDWDLGL
ncbi:MAG: 5'/3'-nucleotidase SurE [Anaerolineae bacterium]|jgi:5'-nucleotidase